MFLDRKLEWYPWENKRSQGKLKDGSMISKN